MTKLLPQKHLFSLPQEITYFCGHSLGPQPKSASYQVQQGLQAWENHVVSAWNSVQWINLPQKLGASIAPLIGANQNEVIVTDNTTINIMKLLLSAVSLHPERRIILTESDNFPADVYIAENVATMQNMRVKAVIADNILEAMDESIAVLLLTHVNYRTSQKHDMAAITQKAKALGIITVWDLSHSVGIMPLHCSRIGVDFAVGCTYKYLNGGPGAPSFLYVNQKHHNSISPPIHGWMGHQNPFAFSPDYTQAEGVRAYLTGTPSILSMKALEGALEVFKEQNLSDLEKMNLKLTDYLIEQCEKHVPALQCVSPKRALRGAHVAFTHQDAYAISRALIEKGVIIDYREPGIIRFGVSPLYIDFEDIDKAVEKLREVIQAKLYALPQYHEKLAVI